MCLITFNWDNHPAYKLILVANRDEFFDRPSQEIHQWEAGFYGGKDLRAGGTWLAIHPNGRFAFLTNYRDMRNIKSDRKSRGELVKNYLSTSVPPFEYLKSVEQQASEFEGFNLVVGDHLGIFYLSNYQEGIQEISSGLYGLSNALLDTPWPKLTLAKEGLENLIAAEIFDPISMMPILHSQEIAPDEELPETGLSLARERLMSCQFIHAEGIYGTVNTTVLLWKHTGEVTMVERKFDQLKNTHADTSLQFEIIKN
ncbi:NRDE family protein [Mongoliitalea lutea]|uniref:Transport and Golgi organisation 2 n=1 Tax=Mongoliitalea lutea TaxID=849756 RepID=A0A8J3CZ83_9BACT|nr:NRDE family protein [Mongoliitalea lutea]GHB41074.1 hypothetical protein GCM10008106_22750 [Mongoliitalea lutea]